MQLLNLEELFQRILDKAVWISWTSLGKVLLNQIWYLDFLGQSPAFKCSKLQDQLFCTVLKVLVPYIMDAEMEAITSN